jgi:putative ABC transport system permease protein
MKAIPAVRAARGGLSGRRVQGIVIGLVVGVSTAASTLALGVVVDSNAPFGHSFAAQHGADVTATVTGASAAELAATTHLKGVTAAAGPYPETTVATTAQVTPPGEKAVTVDDQLTVVGRSSPGGPVDDLTLSKGHWATGPGQIVWANSPAGLQLPLGSQVTVTGVAGSPKLTVVGVATSITGSAQGWVTPGEIGALEAAGAPASSQMLYDFSGAGSTAAVNADIAEVTAALPHVSVGAQSWLTAKAQATSSSAPWVPFIVAFGLIGLVMSVLIVINVVSGAVVSGIRRIGVLKSIGFSPGQVVASYALQVAVPAVIGCVIGAVAANALAVPLLGLTSQAYSVGGLALPLWVDLVVPLGMLGLVGGTAVAIALRAGRMSATAAIATGRAPRAKHGYAALRLLGRGPLARLPRPLTIGLAGPFARPSRTLVTMAAIVFGVTAVIFGFGLGASLNQVEAELSLRSTEQVHVFLAGREGPVALNGHSSTKLSLAQQESAVQAALKAQPGTLHDTMESDGMASVPGLSDQLTLTGFTGDSSWIGYTMISGHWYSGADQVDVNTAFLTDTGAKVGGDYTLITGGKHITVQIVGEVFAPEGGHPEMLGSTSTMSAINPNLGGHMFQAELAPGTDVGSYVNGLQSALGSGYLVAFNDSSGSVLPAIMALDAILTLLIAVVAGFGVLNTVVLQTRERVHDLGVFKAVGMTPRQTIALMVSTVAGIGLVAGLLAIPAGVALHQFVLPIMGNGAHTALPSAVLDVYHAPELAVLALSGLVIAVVGALAPAGWAARARTAVALRAE